MELVSVEVTETEHFVEFEKEGEIIVVATQLQGIAGRDGYETISSDLVTFFENKLI